MHKLQDRTLIVTGAASGIGRSAALRLAKLGAKVAVADVTVEGGEETAEMIRREGGQAIFIETDVGQEDAVRELVARVVAQWGRLDAAFNNAGVEQPPSPLHQLSLSEWRRVTETDLTGVFLCLKHEIAAMLETGGGAILNTSSALGQVGLANTSAYTAAKHGVIGLTKAAAVEYSARGIRINAILPGAIATAMFERPAQDPGFAAQLEKVKAAHPIGRMGRPEEIADVVAWLLSDGSSYMTGASIAVDGGYLAV